MLRTPSSVTAEIQDLCQSLNASSHPDFIPITLEPGCEPTNCFWNVRSKVHKEGGQIQFGWAIWEWPHVFIEAEHHAVYVPPTGSPWIDITPDESLPPATHRFFLPDDTAVYNFDKRGRGLNNVRKALVDDPLIQDHFRLADERREMVDAVAPSVGEEVTLRGSAAELYRQNQDRAKVVQLHLTMKYTSPDALCPCGSGSQFKRCHGKIR